MLSCFQNLPKNVNCAQIDFYRYGVNCSLFQTRGNSPEISFISRDSFDERGNRWCEEGCDFDSGHFCFADMDTVLRSKDGELTILGYDDVTPEMRTLWDYMRDFWGRTVDACLDGRITCRPNFNEGDDGGCDFVCGDRSVDLFLDPDTNHGVIVENGHIRFKGRRMSERFIMAHYHEFAYLLGDEDHV